jgi:hypothetical protein
MLLFVCTKIHGIYTTNYCDSHITDGNSMITHLVTYSHVTTHSVSQP